MPRPVGQRQLNTLPLTAMGLGRTSAEPSEPASVGSLALSSVLPSARRLAEMSASPSVQRKAPALAGAMEMRSVWPLVMRLALSWAST